MLCALFVILYLKTFVRIPVLFSPGCSTVSPLYGFFNLDSYFPFLLRVFPSWPIYLWNEFSSTSAGDLLVERLYIIVILDKQFIKIKEYILVIEWNTPTRGVSTWDLVYPANFWDTREIREI